MAVSNKALQRLMKPAGVGEPIDIDSFADDVAVMSASFAEPFWDPPEQYREAPDEHVGYPLDIEGSATYAENPWDCVDLGSHQLPGLWTVTATPSLKLDIQKPIGYDGAAIITRGYQPAGLTLTGLLWTGAQWKLMQDILPAIWQRPFKVSAQDVKLGKKGKITTEQTDEGEIVVTRKSMAISHPSLSPLGIFYVVIQAITPLAPHSIPGVRQMTIQCVEYVPEPSVKPSAVRKTQGGTVQSRGANAVDKKIAENDARNPKAPSKRKEAIEP
jgi:hypothetical protein